MWEEIRLVWMQVGPLLASIPRTVFTVLLSIRRDFIATPAANHRKLAVLLVSSIFLYNTNNLELLDLAVNGLIQLSLRLAPFMPDKKQC
jgi:hypothetical protein